MTDKIHQMIGELSAAFWERATQPGVSPLAAILAPQYKPESDKELEIWHQLTSPINFDELERFVQSAMDAPITDYARKLYQSIFAAAAGRHEAWLLEREKGGASR